MLLVRDWFKINKNRSIRSNRCNRCPCANNVIPVIGKGMEAFVYTFFLLGSLGVIFFAILLRDPPRIK